MTDPGPRGSDRINRALEVAVFAPLGIGLYLKDIAPSFLSMFVARGRAEVDRRQEQVDQRVRHAKGMGEVTVAFGVPMLRKRADEKIAAVRDRAETALRASGLHPAGSPERGSGTPTTAPGRRAPVATRNESAETASTVAAGTGSDAATSQAAPGSRAGSDAPDLAIPGYDALSASQVVVHLAGLAGDELEAVRAYETTHRNRRTILGKIDQLTH